MWHHARIVFSTTEISLSIDGNTAVTQTTDLPTTGMHPYIRGLKSVGTTSRNLDVDLMRIQGTFDSARY